MRAQMRSGGAITRRLFLSSAGSAAGIAAFGLPGLLQAQAGHGIAVTGPSIPYAVGRSIYTQINADLQQKAISPGGSVDYLDPREAQAMLDSGENRGYSRSWELWKRDTLAAMRNQQADSVRCLRERAMPISPYVCCYWRRFA